MAGVSVTNVAVAVGGSGVDVNASVGGRDVNVGASVNRTSVGGIGVTVGAGSALFAFIRNGREAATMVAKAPIRAMIIFWLRNGSDLRFSSMAATFFLANSITKGTRVKEDPRENLAMEILRSDA
jgi:hypothetical protein